jgi:hypothetical protein
MATIASCWRARWVARSIRKALSNAFIRPASHRRPSVRAVISGIEGWLPAANLRGTETFVPAAPDASAVADTVTVDSGRRFGETAHRR